MRNLDESWLELPAVRLLHGMTAIEGLGPIYQLLHTMNFPRYVILFAKVFVLNIL